MKQTGYGVGPDPAIQQGLLRIEGGQRLKLGNHFLKTGNGRQGADEGVAVVLGQLLFLIAGLRDGARRTSSVIVALPEDKVAHVRVGVVVRLAAFERDHIGGFALQHLSRLEGRLAALVAFFLLLVLTDLGA